MRNEEIRERLRATDPVAREPGLSMTEIQVMRRAIAAGADRRHAADGCRRGQVDIQSSAMASLESEIDKIAQEIDRLQKDGDPEGRIPDLSAYLRVLNTRLAMELQKRPWGPQ